MAIAAACVMLDASGEPCARSVQRLSSMTRAELTAFLEETARASACVVPARAARAKPPKMKRSPRASWR